MTSRGESGTLGQVQLKAQYLLHLQSDFLVSNINLWQNHLAFTGIFLRFLLLAVKLARLIFQRVPFCPRVPLVRVLWVRVVGTLGHRDKSIKTSYILWYKTAKIQ